MSVISTAPAVKAALVDRLRADAALAGVQISHGHPYPDRLEREVVIVGRVTAQSRVGDRYQGGHTPRALGSAGAREERYSIELVLNTSGAARDRYPDLEARAYAIADAIDESVRAWRSTTPAAYDGVARWVLVASVEDREGLSIPGRDTEPPEGGRECVVRVELNVAAGV